MNRKLFLKNTLLAGMGFILVPSVMLADDRYIVLTGDITGKSFYLKSNQQVKILYPCKIDNCNFRIAPRESNGPIFIVPEKGKVLITNSYFQYQTA